MSRYSRPRKLPNRYDWKAVQLFHDEGNSWREITSNFGVYPGAIKKAIARGDFISRRTSSEGMSIAHRKGRYGESPFRRPEHRRNVSIRQSLSNSGGRSKWYVVAGKKVQGTWERDFALKLEQWGVRWTRPSKKRDAWPYEMDGKKRHYSPDFYLSELKAWVEIKGHWWGDDVRKMMAVSCRYPRRKIIIIEKREFHEVITSIAVPAIISGR